MYLLGKVKSALNPLRNVVTTSTPSLTDTTIFSPRNGILVCRG